MTTVQQTDGAECPVAVMADPPERMRAEAESLAERLGLPLHRPESTPPPLLLAITPQRLELRATGRQKTHPVYVDFVEGKLAHRRAEAALARQMLGRAVGFKRAPLRVCDATAGLGRDAFLLAYMGCTVTAVERSPVLAALLEDGLRRAREDAEIGLVVRERLRLVQADARAYLETLPAEEWPEVVYIDPMFPERAKSALAKKEMRLCRVLTGDDPDAGELWETAIRRARSRVVVKRPLHGPSLGGKPQVVYKGKSIRYDVYLPGR